MSEWITTKLGDHISVLPGFPFQSELFSTESGTPLIRIRDLLSDRLETFYQGTFDEQFLVRDGDILIGMDGDFNVVRWNKGKALLNQRVCAVAATSAGLDGGFLYWIIGPRIDEIHRITPQTTVKHLSTKDLRSIRLDLPSRPEQSAIARILDTVDTQIEKTQALITKLEQVKEGLLHDLLTRGVDESGELRPSAEEAPELYKASPLGLIPRGWEVVGVMDIPPTTKQAILTGPFGAQLGQNDFVAQGVPVLRIGNVQAGYIDWSDVQYVAEKKASALERFRVQSGDLLFARQGATTGRNALADNRSDRALINYHIIRVAVDRDRCLPKYLYAAFNSSTVQRKVDQDKGRGTREGINSAQIAAMRFPLPEMSEQRLLVRRMDAIDARLSLEERMIADLRLLIIGLMDDLLTGRVRVTPLLDREPAEAT